ncbi:MAG: ATP-dependent Clp protease ATP-binding subunit [Clostridia bacterium]|nr:ATP-dependent Clp protease ATP-binding subunit [Clostridia bacterium]
MKRLTTNAAEAISKSQRLASQLGHSYVGSEHLLLGLLTKSDSIAARLLAENGATFDAVKNAIVEASGTGDVKSGIAPEPTPRTKKIIENTVAMADITGQNFIGTEHILMAILTETDCVACKILTSLGIDISDLFAKAKGDGADFSFKYNNSPSYDNSGRASYSEEGAGRSKTPELEKYSTDLTALAKNGKIDPVIGREKETQRVIEILSRRTKNNPCLIGEPGVGKTAVVEGLALLVSTGAVPETVKDKRVVALDLASVLAGTKYRGEFEERIKNIMDEVKKASDVILFIDEIHTIVGAGASEGAVDAANILKPALSRGEIQVIGATTLDEYRKYIEKDAALERRFGSVMVEEPSSADAIMILKGLRDKYEAHHKVKISDSAIEAAVNLSVRYIGDRFLPDKAIDLIDETASRIRIQNVTAPTAVIELEQKLTKIKADKEEAVQSQKFEEAGRLHAEERMTEDKLKEEKAKWEKGKSEHGEITDTDIADTVTNITGIPVNKLAKEEQSKLLGLDNVLKSRVIGQDEAVEVVAKAVRRGRMGLKDPKRPQGSFIFCGPTGVGKTELSKALAEAVFGDENAIIRIDMSEYMEKHSVSKLIGAPPGYVGFDDAGQLTEKIRRKPYSVVLFDEIEKAHPDVFNIMLQVLEDGHLTDSHGRKVDFKNTIIIMTSNLGSSNISEPRRLGFSAVAEEKDTNDKTREIVMNALRDNFRPEFLNRLDEIVIFNKLSGADIEKITRLMLGEVAGRIERLGIAIEFSDEVCAHLARIGFDPTYGARPLRRAIQQRIEDSFSTGMLEGNIKAGDKVLCTLLNDEIIYKVEEQREENTAESTDNTEASEKSENPENKAEE